MALESCMPLSVCVCVQHTITITHHLSRQTNDVACNLIISYPLQTDSTPWVKRLGSRQCGRVSRGDSERTWKQDKMLMELQWTRKMAGGKGGHSMEQHTQWRLMNKHGDVLTSGVATFLPYTQGVSILSAKKVARKN